MNQINIKHYLIFASILIGIVLTLIVLLLLNTSFSPRSSEPNLTPPPVTSPINPPQITSLPKMTDHPYAIDPKSEPTLNSQKEIAKIISNFPYRAEHTLSTKKKVTIVIPGQQFQDAPWRLSVTVLGIDYQIPEDHPTYTDIRGSFIESAAIIFKKIRGWGADPEKIIYRWGDKAIVQERAEKWLTEE